MSRRARPLRRSAPPLVRDTAPGRWTSLAMTLLLTLAGCAEEAARAGKGGEGEGEEQDAGSLADAGGPGRDAAVATDGGPPGDATTVADGGDGGEQDGAAADAASPGDGGSGMGDAGAADARPSPEDVASRPDAEDGGTATDGPPAPGCQAGVTPDGCGEGTYCDAATGRCVPAAPCAGHASCPAGFRCVYPGSCLPVRPPDCVLDADCPGDWRCDRWRGGVCLPPERCDGDEDCWAGAGCHLDSQRCTSCSALLPCPGRQRCLPGPDPLLASCADAAWCFEDRDCPGERRCQEGICRATACRDDGHEPNDAAFQAPLLQDMDHPGLMLCGDDQEDWYRIAVPPDGGLRVELRQPVESPVQLALYAPGGLPGLLEVDPSGARQLVVQTAGGGGRDTYLVRVSSRDGQPRSYALSIRTAPGGACPGDAFDRQPGDPLPVPLTGEPVAAVLCPRTVDRFAVAGDADEQLVASLEVAPGLAAPQVVLQAPSGEIIADGEPVPAGWQTSARLPASGIYRLLVTGEPPSRGAPYVLQVSLGARPERDRCQQAALLTDGLAVSTSPLLQDIWPTGCGAAAASRPEGAVRLELDEAAAVRVVALTGAGDPAGGEADEEGEEGEEGGEGGEGREGVDPGVVLSLRGSCLRPGHELACGAAGVLEVPALPAGRYQVLAERAARDDATPVRLLLGLAAPAGPPANGSCAGATELLAELPVDGTLWGAASDGQGDWGCGSVPGVRAARVYHRFALAEPALVRLEAEALAPLAVSVSAGCAGGPALLCGAEENVLQPGDYRVMVAEAEPGHPSDYRLTLHVQPAPEPPPSSLCASAAPLPPGLPVSAETRRARNDEVASCGGEGPDLFFRLLVPPLPDAPERPQVLQVYMQSEFAAALTVGSSCAAADLLGCWPVDDELRARAVVAPGEVILGVDGRSASDWGRFSLLASLPAAPPGDRCEEPVPLPMGQRLEGSTVSALDDWNPGPQGCAGGFPMAGPDVFFALELAAGEQLDATLDTPGWDGALYLLAGCGGPCLAGSDRALQGETERLSFAAPRAGSYLLVVDSFGGHGSFRLLRGH